METKSAMISYNINPDEDGENLTQIFGKDRKEFIKKVNKMFSEPNHGDTITRNLISCLEENIFDGSDLMILASIGLNIMFQEFFENEMMKNDHKCNCEECKESCEDEEEEDEE